MTWVRLDDKFWRNEKARRLSHAARGVFCDCLSFCGDVPQAELSGFLTHRQAVDRATGSVKLVDELVHNGFLEPVNGGYLVHDFDHYVPKTSTERVRKWRERKRCERVSETLHLSRARDGKPEPVPEPVPVGVENPSVGFPTETENGYGVPETHMHVNGLTTLSETLGTLRIQPNPRKEAIS